MLLNPIADGIHRIYSHRTVADTARVAQALQRRIWPLLEQGRIAPVIHQVFPLDAVAAAHRMLASDEVIGKLVLSVGPPAASGTDTGARPK